MNNFWKRTATAVIFVIVLLAAIWHPVSCALLFGVIALLSVNEFYNITRHDTDSHVNKIGGMFLAAALVAIPVIVVLEYSFNTHPVIASINFLISLVTPSLTLWIIYLEACYLISKAVYCHPAYLIYMQSIS